MNVESEEFGTFLINDLRDVIIELGEGLCASRYDSPNHKVYQKKLEGLTEEQKDILIKTLGYCVDISLGSCLYKLNKSKSIEGIISATSKSNLFEGNNPRRTYNLWIEKFSKYSDFDK